jgi:hypothetical protein
VDRLPNFIKKAKPTENKIELENKFKLYLTSFFLYSLGFQRTLFSRSVLFILTFGLKKARYAIISIPQTKHLVLRAVLCKQYNSKLPPGF